MENYDELYHWGIKGQKWGVRRYQNKDGTLTPAGQKRYNKEMAKLKAEESKLKAEQKVLNNKKKTQAKIDKLESKKSELEAQKKALKEEQKALKSGKKNDKAEKEKPVVDTEAQREALKQKVLATRSAEEIYKNAHLFDDNELKAAYNRLNLEGDVKKLIPKEVSKGEQIADKLSKTGKTVNSLYETGTTAWNSFASLYNAFSEKGKTNPLPYIQKPKNDKDNNDNNKKKDNNQNQNQNQNNQNNGGNNQNNNQGGQNQQQNQGGNDQSNNQQSNNQSKNSQKNQSSNNNQSSNQQNNTKTESKTETYSGTVEGVGTSSSRYNYNKSNTKSKPADYYDPIDMPVSGLPATTTSKGKSFIAGLLEKKD